MNHFATPPGTGQSPAALGVDPGRAQAIVSRHLDWRSGTPGGSFSHFDQYYLSLTPSFRARHASLEEIEELLLVRGVTPDLFYGGYVPDAQRKADPARRPARLPVGLRFHRPLDVNTVRPKR